MFSIFLFIISSSTIAFATKSYEKHYDHSIEAPVKSYHSIHTYPAKSVPAHIKNPVIDINSGPLPLTIRFNSHSSHINAIQKHFGSPGQVQKSSHVDHPDLLIQNVKKPIIQEVREVITPYRHRTQEVRPVHEKIETIIAKDKHETYSKEGGTVGEEIVVVGGGGGGGGSGGGGEDHKYEYEAY
ncbi:hypothetical protein RDWZM_006899 [Blomia tropicalis]|uniref:Uncharacterized protein n=1 Tax=Blomia tropicalis TaxID=40697 RepID=A0A9Q0MBE4_BLOTA|nr:hypothetical protein RDWZM_006899 [Blomia tropicalis]